MRALSFRIERFWGAAVLMTAWTVPSASAGENLVSNPAFEVTRDGQPQGWTTHTWSGNGEFALVDDGRDGTRGVRITSTDGGDLAWQTTAPVRPGGVYRLSGWTRTVGMEPGSGRGALLNVHQMPASATAAVCGTSDWTCVESIVRAGGRESITVNCLFGGWGRSTGTATYDDIRLEELDLSNFKPEVVIRAHRERAPIHPFIYGQFIEHLGRCIYGGIWSEMLEDRKFYFPIEADYRPYRAEPQDRAMQFPVVARSPWQIIGDPAGVSMVREDSFVGDHTPLLQPGAAIQQNDLGIVAGEKYTGYIWLKSPGAARATVTLSGAHGDAAIADVGRTYEKHEFSFVADDSTNEASLRITVSDGPVYVGTISLMPADNISGMRKDTLALIKQLDAPIYRWPGGNFVSGYNWRDGIGDRDRRPPRKNPAWTGVEHNDFGIDEFLEFCRIVGTEPLIAVNDGFGDSYSAAQEVQYCNAGTDTIGGRWRAANGHPEPYGVKYWCIGNEMYGNWQLGYMQFHHYVLKHNDFAEKMLAVDPHLTLVAVGNVGDWSQGMLRHCADQMDLISEHFYCGAMDDVINHVQQTTNNVRRIAEAHRAYRRQIPRLAGKNIRIAMDEWNYWYDHDRYVYGELGTRYRHRDALGIAAGLHEYFRQSDIIEMANYAQTVNVIGCIKTTKTDAFLATTALPLMLYRRHFGAVPVELDGDFGVLALDVAAAWTEKRDALTIGVVNPNAAEVTLRADIEGADVGEDGAVWQVATSDPNAYNDAQNQRVGIVSGQFQFDGRLRVPAFGIALFRLETK